MMKNETNLDVLTDHKMIIKGQHNESLKTINSLLKFIGDRISVFERNNSVICCKALLKVILECVTKSSLLSLRGMRSNWNRYGEGLLG